MADTPDHAAPNVAAPTGDEPQQTPYGVAAADDLSAPVVEGGEPGARPAAGQGDAAGHQAAIADELVHGRRSHDDPELPENQQLSRSDPGDDGLEDASATADDTTTRGTKGLHAPRQT
jgi:hypothetical protein